MEESGGHDAVPKLWFQLVQQRELRTIARRVRRAMRWEGVVAGMVDVVQPTTAARPRREELNRAYPKSESRFAILHSPDGMHRTLNFPASSWWCPDLGAVVPRRVRGVHNVPLRRLSRRRNKPMPPQTKIEAAGLTSAIWQKSVS